ncbi:MAG: hypothetical protein JWP02_1542 [Acidimicrobiales bacterium]|nr:hypothetical protein [Acidimicrobiales bacterium]
MPFPRRLLNDNESVVLDLRPHWWVLVGVSVVLAASLALAIVVSNVVHGAAHDPVLIVSLVVVLVALVRFVRRYARWATTNIVLTTHRLVLRSGVFAKSGREIPLERINDIAYHQGVFERLIGAGDLAVESAGERGQEVLRKVPRPDRVQQEIYRQMEDAQHRSGERLAGTAQLSVPEQLERLDELRRRGVITQAEFDRQKEQLLRRI